MFLNRVILIGRIVTDISEALKYTPSGVPVLQFRMAVDRPQSSEARSSGQPKQTDFITIVAWRQSAEFAANFLSKGRLVAVEGQLHIREFEHQGQKRREAEVNADNLKSLDSRPTEDGDGGGGNYGRQNGGGGGYNDGGEDAFEAPAAPAPARQPAPARAQAAPPARPAAAPARPAAGGGNRGNYQPPAEDDLDDPFADN